MAKLTSAKARKILHDKSVHGQPLTDKQRRFFGAIAGGAKPYKAESGGWLDKYDAPIAQNGIEGTMGGLTDKGFNYNGAWGGTMQMGGSLPGAVGFTYARVAGAAPANGPYAKKTKASAQNGMEMKYYQQGLDFKPKTISQDGITIDPMGYWNPENVGNPVIIPSNEITMEGVDQPLIGISDTGDVQYMQPGEEYTFDGKYVTEYPVAQKGTKVPAATTADSLALFNNAQKIVDYYKSKNYRTKRMDYGENPYAFNQLDEAREAFLKHSLVTVPTTSKKLKFVAPKDIENLYYKNVDKNKFYQRENANAILDTRSPMPLYDRRITPTAYMAFDNVNENDPLHLDIVSISGYDPIAVKPYAMLTPEEKKLREQRYGKPKKETPKSSIKPKTKIEQPIKKTEQPKPVERKQNVYEGTPVYAPTPYSPGAGAVVGFVDKKGDTTYIKPEDYERMGVPKYGRDFIQKKMKNGGVSVNMADQYPIEKLDQSLNFTNYNKPTKGGWLDKYK